MSLSSPEHTIETTHDPEIIKREFDEFTYIVSHDFQAPLRHVREFSKLLVESFDESELTPKQVRYSNYLQQGVEQAESMLQALLEYSRINTRSFPFVPVSPGRLIRDVIDDLQDDISISGAVIEYDNLPEVHADQSQLRRVFYHLIKNSVMYAKDGKPPYIHISAEEKPLYFTFKVKDTGKGIETEKSEIPFKLFNRLDSDYKSGSVGAGLSMVQKIIKCHYGSVWIDSMYKDGTTVCFTIMKQSQNTDNMVD